MILTAEAESFEVGKAENGQAVEKAGAFPAIPIKVVYHSPEYLIEEMMKYGRLSHEEAEMVEEIWSELVREYCELPPSSSWHVAKKSGHHIHLDEPTFIVGSLKLIAEIVKLKIS